MATYPDGNPGVYPVDLSSPVGVVRMNLNDTVGEEYDPPVAGFRNFKYFSDEEIEIFLFQAEGSTSRATGYAFLTLASTIAMSSGVTVRTDDLQYSDTNRVSGLRDIAQFWFDKADQEDEIAGLDEAFVVVPMSSRRCRCGELAEAPAWCHRGC